MIYYCCCNEKQTNTVVPVSMYPFKKLISYWIYIVQCSSANRTTRMFSKIQITAINPIHCKQFGRTTSQVNLQVLATAAFTIPQNVYKMSRCPVFCPAVCPDVSCQHRLVRRVGGAGESITHVLLRIRHEVWWNGTTTRADASTSTLWMNGGYLIAHTPQVQSFRKHVKNAISLRVSKCETKQEVKVIWQKAPHGGPFPG